MKDRARVIVETIGANTLCDLTLTPSGARGFRRNAARLGILKKGDTLSDTLLAFLSHQIRNGAPILHGPKPRRRAVKGKRYSVTARAAKGGKAS